MICVSGLNRRALGDYRVVSAKFRQRIREFNLITTKMDAHLVGYGSSSEDEGKSKKHEQQMNPFNKERHFRKRSISPEQDQNETSPSRQSGTLDLMGDLLKTPKETERVTDSNAGSSPTKPPLTRSRSPSPSRPKHAKHSPGKSPDKKQKNHGRKNRSRSRSSSSSTDKESRSAVDEFGRRVRRQHSEKSKDEERGNKDRRTYPRDQRKSRSRSRSKERDRDQGGFRRHDRRRDERYKANRGNRRRYSDRGRNRSPEKLKVRSPERTRNRSPERPRDRSPERSKNRSQEIIRERSPERSRERIERRSHVYLGGTEKKAVVPVKDKVIMSSEEIEKRLAARAESMKQEAQVNASNLNLPSYLNPAVVNPQLYAKQQEKRKLLWSSKKTEQVPSNSKMWVGTKFAGDQGGEVQAKFRRLMGIKEGETGGTEEDGSSTGENILTGLEKEFERSRAFQLSRGAGGKSGIGLGYASANYN